MGVGLIIYCGDICIRYYNMLKSDVTVGLFILVKLSIQRLNTFNWFGRTNPDKGSISTIINDNENTI